MIKKLKALKEPLTISGDGRHDSMGHSAKFGAYTIFCCSLPLIIHFALVQVNIFALVELEGEVVFIHIALLDTTAIELCMVLVLGTRIRSNFQQWAISYPFQKPRRPPPPSPCFKPMCNWHIAFVVYLLQRNEVGSSIALEYADFQWAMTFLLGCGLAIGTFISDRHVSIAKHMREKLSNITHFFDLWHLKKRKHSLHDVKIFL